MLIIKHEKEENKFFSLVDGVEAHLLYKVVDDETLDFYSTFVPKEGRGMGLAKKLVDVGLDYAKENNFKVIPSCSYVESYFEKNPEMSSLKKS